MSDRIFVIETISDGAQGFPYDEVLSMGICSVDLEAGDFDSVYDATVSVEPKYVGKTKLDYAESMGFEVGRLYDGVPVDIMAKDFRAIVRDQYVTSYDIRQEFTKYLTNAPWDVTYETHIMPSIMMRQPISLRCKRPESEPLIIRKAYSRMFDGDPARVGKDTSALALAQMASQIMIELHARGKY